MTAWFAKDSARKLRIWLRQRERLVTLLIAVALGLGGGTLVTVAALAQESPAQATNIGKITASAKAQATLDYAVPVNIMIPAINVQSVLTEVGKNPDGSVQVPAGASVDDAAWYRYSAAPGESGAAVIIGHVDTYKSGPSVFFNLGKLKPGNVIIVQRSDGITAVFTVQAVRVYQKTNFPSAQVYGPDGAGAELHLVTCSGDYVNGNYVDNTIVYATLTGSYSNLQLEQA